MFRQINTMGLLGVSLVTIQVLGLSDSWAVALAPFWGPPLFSFVWGVGRRITRRWQEARQQ